MDSDDECEKEVLLEGTVVEGYVFPLKKARRRGEGDGSMVVRMNFWPGPHGIGEGSVAASDDADVDRLPGCHVSSREALYSSVCPHPKAP